MTVEQWWSTLTVGEKRDFLDWMQRATAKLQGNAKTETRAVLVGSLLDILERL